MLDCYQILCVHPTASLAEIKLAYHTLLLKHHPDKNIHPTPHHPSVDIGLIKDAYAVLASPLSRAQYDASLTKLKEPYGPRPAQLVSLDEFTQLDLEGKINAWDYPCRCGGLYRIYEADMENGQHLVACKSCSEVVWVGYEVQEDDT